MSLILTNRERQPHEIAWFWNPLKEQSFGVGYLGTLADVQDYMISWKQTNYGKADLTFLGWAKDQRDTEK